MASIEIELPDGLPLATGPSTEEFVREAKLLLAVKLFELGRISSGRAAELAGLSRIDFLFEAGRAGVPVADLDDEEMASVRRPSGRALRRQFVSPSGVGSPPGKPSSPRYASTDRPTRRSKRWR